MKKKLKSKIGDQFTVAVADGMVLMEVTSLRCGDVWDCNPVNTKNEYADEYGRHMVFTDDQIAPLVSRHNFLTKK